MNACRHIHTCIPTCTLAYVCIHIRTYTYIHTYTYACEATSLSCLCFESAFECRHRSYMLIFVFVWVGGSQRELTTNHID